MTDIANLAFQVNTKSLTSASTSLKNFKKVGEDTERSIMRNTSNIKTSFQSVAPAIKTTGTAAAVAAPKMAGFGHQARMMSMQLSQVAQQGSVTGNYLQALAIQLPDLMLGFGTLGILIGAVAGSLAVPLINALTGSSKELQKFNDLIDETKEGLQSVRLENAIGTIDALTDSIKENEKELSILSDKTFKKMGGRATSNARRLELQAENQKKISELEKDQVKNKEALLVLEKRKADILASTDDTSAAEAISLELEARKKLAAEVRNIEQGMESPAAKAVREASERAAVLQAAQDAEIESIRSYDDLKRENAKRLADDLVAIAKGEQEQKTQILTAGQQAGLSIVGGLMGQMASLAKEGGEKQFEAYKAFATAQALISTSLAVAGVLGQTAILGPAAIPLAAAVGVMGVAQVAMIEQQRYQGARAMGGQVEGGGKYLVGENGPEVLQLGSQGGSVTPNHALGGGGGNVTTVVNIAAGVTKAELEAFAPTIISSSVNAVKQQIAAGGTMSRAVGRR